MSIRPVTSSTSIATASPVVSLGFSALTHLFPKVFATPTAVEIPAPPKPIPKDTAIPNPEKSIFSDSQRSSYFLDTTNGLPRCETENKLHQLKETDFSSELEFLYEKASLAAQTAENYEQQAKTASVADRPLILHQARSVLRDVLLPPEGDRLNSDHTFQITILRDGLAIAEARACQEAARHAISVQEKLGFVFAGIAALSLSHSELLKGLPLRAMNPLEPFRFELGVELWKTAAEILESLPSHTAIDYRAFAFEVMKSDRIKVDVWSPQHAAAHCYINLAMTVYDQGYVLASAQPEKMITLAEPLRQNRLNCLAAAIRLLKRVDLSNGTYTDEQRAWLQEEIAETCLKRSSDPAIREALTLTPLQRLSMHNETYTESVKAAKSFKAAATESENPLKFFIQMARFSGIAADFAPSAEDRLTHLKQAHDASVNASKQPYFSSIPESHRPFADVDSLKQKIEFLEQEIAEENSWSTWLLSHIFGGGEI